MHLLDSDSGALLGTLPAPRQAQVEFANDHALVVSGHDDVRWYDASSERSCRGTSDASPSLPTSPSARMAL